MASFRVMRCAGRLRHGCGFGGRAAGMLSTAQANCARIAVRSFCQRHSEGRPPERKKRVKGWGQPEQQAKVLEYIENQSRLSQEVRDLMVETQRAPDAGQASTLDQLPVLGMLAKLVHAKCIIDIGTFTGLSALQFALSVDGCRVITIDKRDTNLELAKKYWRMAGVADSIEARIGDGLLVLDELESEGYSQKVDLAFIDANKLASDAYYEKLLTMVRPGGLIVIDNALWYASVVDHEQDDKITCSIRALNDKLLHDGRIDYLLLPSGDGMNVCLVR